MKKALVPTAMLALVLVVWPATGMSRALQEGERILTVQPIVSQMTFKPGETREVGFELTVAPGFHVNSNIPLEEFLVPTELRLKPSEGISFGRAAFPAAKVKTLEFSEQPLSIFDGSFVVRLPVTVAPGYGKNTFAIEGTVVYQACDDLSCLAPAETNFRAVYPVTAAGKMAAEKPAVQEGARGGLIADRVAEEAPGAGEGASSKPERLSGRETDKPAAPPSAGADDLTRTVREKGLLLTFLLVFLGGLALNLTPCVYPLIPITVGYFGGQAGGRKGSLLGHALLYVLGMAVTYSFLGTLAALTGGLFGEALRYPAVLAGIAAVMVALALSMFGVYEFRLPGFLNRLAGPSRRGFFGSFFMGLTVGVVAAPCIGPFVLGLLTYVGDRGNVLLGFWLFFLLALGLGTPFLALAVFSGSINRLPRSGGWMVWVRKIFGFILLGMAVYFLKTLFPDSLLYSLTLALTALLAGIYLAWLEPTRTGGKVFPFVRSLTGLAFFALALALAYTGIRQAVDRRVTELVSRSGGAPSLLTIAWRPYSDDLIRRATRDGQPVFIDFTADWCIPCQEMDDRTFSDPAVIELSRRFLMLRADMTSSRNRLTGELRDRYRLAGMPTLVFLGPRGGEIAGLRRAGFVDKGAFLALMRSALASPE